MPIWEQAGSSIAALGLHYNASSGCVSGVSATYGKDGQSARPSYEVLGSGQGNSGTKPPTRASIKLGAEEVVERVDALWVAGFPADGHPARDLRYIERIPLTRD